MGTERKRLTQRYYDARAKDYDRQKNRTWKSSSGFSPTVTRMLADAVKSLENGLLLEVGVGTGRNALPILKKTETRLVGLDLSREMLKQARAKLSCHKEDCDLVLGDAENMPFRSGVFSAVVCMSTMHYFPRQREVLRGFFQTLLEGGLLVYGDLSVHESDEQGFFEKLERRLSKAHARYYKPSEMNRVLEDCDFSVFRTRTVAYRKSLQSLIEDKGQYFEVPSHALLKLVEEADEAAQKHYNLTNTELTQYYTVIVAQKKQSTVDSCRKGQCA